MTRRLFVKTYGCQMNVYDSARMTELLKPLGYAPVDAPEAADMVILNTCHIREKAAEKVYSEIGRLRPLKERARAEGRDMVIAVAGCVAQAEGAEMAARAPAVDIVVGPQAYHRLPQMLAEIARGAGRALDTAFPVEDKFDALPQAREVTGPSAFLTVQEGCDKFCTFCVVPYTRGAEVSRPAAAVLAEAKQLIAGGAREITLLGQNVNAWHGEGPGGRAWGLGRLIRALAELPGLDRLRYATSHPRDMDADLIAAHGEVAILMPYLHLPVQAGSDTILRAMNRGHTRDQYFAILDQLRAVRPDIAFSSDFIVGYPGESARDFEDTLDLVRRAGFAQAFSFKYSRRPGTPASAEPRQVPEPEKAARLAALQALLDEQQRGFMRGLEGRTLDVLFDRPGRHEGQAVGRSAWLNPVHVEGAAGLIGAIRPVRILEAQPNSLKGALDPAPAEAA